MAIVVLRLLVAFAAGAACAIWIMKAFLDGGTGAEHSPLRAAATEAVQPLSAGSTQSTAAPVTEPEPRPTQAPASVDLPFEAYRVEISPASDFHAQLLLPHPDVRGESGHRRLHAVLEREPRDESWAHYAESLLRKFFGNPTFAGSIDAVIECRATLCEIQAISFAPEQVGWARVQADLQVQPWYRTEFVPRGSSSGGTGDGHEGILIHLARRDRAR